MKEKEIYGLYDGEYLIFKGTRKEICDMCKIGLHSFYTYVGGERKMNGKYRVHHLVGNEKVVKKPKPKPISKDDEHLEYLFSMLKMYGNTCSVFDPVPYFEKLKDMGITAESRESSLGGWYIEVMA